MFDAKANYRYYVSRGICPKCGKRPADGKRVLCAECAARERESKARTYERRLSEGRCTICGGEIEDKRYKTCEKCRGRQKEHAERKRQYAYERYHAYKDKGICANCGERWVEPGHVYCKDCRRKNDVSHKRYDPNGEKWRERRRKRIEAGLCIDCSRPVENGHVRCKRCLEMRRDSEIKYRIRERIRRESQ